MLQHRNPFVLLFSSLFLTTTLFCHDCSATQFIVGDSAGWSVPHYPTYYKNWSHSNFIRAGDSLEFNFDVQFYNLVQVSKSEYDHCTALEPLKVYNRSPVTLPMKEKGVYFFICSVGTYCCIGQKVAISVHDAAPAINNNPPSPSPLPPQVQISPQLSPNGNPPAPTTTTMPFTPPGSNGSGNGSGHSKSNAVAMLVCRRGVLLSMLVTFLGFWVM